MTSILEEETFSFRNVGTMIDTSCPLSAKMSPSLDMLLNLLL